MIIIIKMLTHVITPAIFVTSSAIPPLPGRCGPPRILRRRINHTS